MLRILAACGLCVLCGACEMSGAEAEAKPAAPPGVLLVRLPDQVVATLTMGPPPLLQQPPRVADGSEALPFATLRAALELAPAGALVRIGEGTFRERLTITRPVVLMGRGAGRTRIVPPDAFGPAVEVRGADRVELHGLSVENAPICVRLEGGIGHRLANVELRGCAEAGLSARRAQIVFVSSSVIAVGRGVAGRGIVLEGGSLEARKLVLRAAGRRGIVLHGARGVLEDLDASGSGLAAVQATDGAEVSVLRGTFEGVGGAALYAGRARLRVEDARVSHDEFAVIGNRGSELTVVGGELTDYRVAGVAMVNSHGSVQRAVIGRGGTEAAISITGSDRRTPVLLTDNRIYDPGSMGVHITQAVVTARGNAITGARLDREKDMGDAFYAIDSDVVIESNVLRGNAGSGISATRCRVRSSENGFIENGRAGLLLLDRSRGTARGNLFERNAQSGVELGELARATLSQNRFGGNVRFDIDAGCGRGQAGAAEIAAGNTFATPMRQRRCAE